MTKHNLQFLSVIAIVGILFTSMSIAPAKAAFYGNCYPDGAGGLQCSDPTTLAQIQFEQWAQDWPGWDFSFGELQYQTGWTGGPPAGPYGWETSSLANTPGRFDTGSSQCLIFSAPVRLFQIILSYESSGGYPVANFHYADGTESGWSDDMRNHNSFQGVTQVCAGWAGYGWNWATVYDVRLRKFWEPIPTAEPLGTLGTPTPTASPTRPATLTPTATSTVPGTPTATGTPTPIAGPTHISAPPAVPGVTAWDCEEGSSLKCSDWLDLPLVNTVWSSANLPADVPGWEGARMWTDPGQMAHLFGYPPEGFDWRADTLMDGAGNYDSSAMQCLFFPEPVPLWGIRIDYTEAPSGRGEIQYSVWDGGNQVMPRSRNPVFTYDKDHLVRDVCIFSVPLGTEWSHVQVSRVQVRRWLYESEFTNQAVGTPTALPVHPTATPGAIDWSTPTPQPTMSADVLACLPWVGWYLDQWECLYHHMEITRVPPGSGGMIDIYGDAMMVLPAAIQFQNVTLDGRAQVSSGTTEPWLAVDPTGLGAGWHMNIAAGDFQDGLGHAIAVGGFRAALPSSSIVRLYGSDLPTTGMNTSTALATTPQLLASAPLGAGMGQFTLQPTFTLDVPASTFAGTYTSIVTVQIVSGP